MIADFLELETKVGRRFREDSVTDIIIASLLRIVGANATVLTPPEVKTGGDFDILIIEPSSAEAIQYRVQAKRLSPHATNWEWGSYRELDHPHGRGGQASTLIRSSAHEKIRTIPLYAFYNPQTACDASGGLISGIELADGRHINQIVKALVKAKAASRRPRYKRLEYLRHLFFPLSTILCPPPGDSGAGAIIRPRASQHAVEAAIESRSRPAWAWDDDAPSLFGPDDLKLLPPEPASPPEPNRDGKALAVRWLPPVVERALERREKEAIQTARVKRPKIILISKGDG